MPSPPFLVPSRPLRRLLLLRLLFPPLSLARLLLRLLLLLRLPLLRLLLLRLPELTNFFLSIKCPGFKCPEYKMYGYQVSGYQMCDSRVLRPPRVISGTSARFIKTSLGQKIQLLRIFCLQQTRSQQQYFTGISYRKECYYFMKKISDFDMHVGMSILNWK